MITLPDLLIQLHEDALLLLGQHLVGVGPGLEEVALDPARELLVHLIVPPQFLHKEQVLVDALPVLAQRRNAVAYLVDHIAEHDDA